MLHGIKNYIINRFTRSSAPYVSSADVELIKQIKGRRLTYLTDAKMHSIAATCRKIEAAGLDGLFLEAGCALGGSTILLARVKTATRALNVYDVFGMIPPPSSEDPEDVHERYRTISSGKSSGIDGDKYYGYENDLYSIVQANLHEFGISPSDARVTLIKGLLQDTLHIEEPIAFAHIDVDWYDPVLTCLSRISPRLVKGGSIILDDYRDWGGCRKATDEYLATFPRMFSKDDAAGSLKLTKVE
jgi:asparagine synthase (glutamine-hydrolysing)